MIYLLDTNVISEVSKRLPSAKVLNFIQAHETQCAVPSIVVAERYHGAHIAPTDQRTSLLKAVHDFREEFADLILPIDAGGCGNLGRLCESVHIKKQTSFLSRYTNRRHRADP